MERKTGRYLWHYYIKQFRFQQSCVLMRCIDALLCSTMATLQQLQKRLLRTKVCNEIIGTKQHHHSWQVIKKNTGNLGRGKQINFNQNDKQCQVNGLEYVRY